MLADEYPLHQHGAEAVGPPHECGEHDEECEYDEGVVEHLVSGWPDDFAHFLDDFARERAWAAAEGLFAVLFLLGGRVLLFVGSG